MTPAPGDHIGLYEIVSLLGKGGMGEVYRARDRKLHRDVAIKVLPAALVSEPDYRARFEREAQSLAALNHPNIAAIYGLEGNAIVMELVEGKALGGPLPLAELLPIARQIAEALEAAHEKGIIHRDLKPGNIKITPEGVVKVLDFGLAKATGSASHASGADSPTLTLRATEAGLILGTAAYMSPEQAAGKAVDRRADIWSFGVVLWELLTGKRLFDGEAATETLADVLRAPIDWKQLPQSTPPEIRELIRRCLDRNAKTRLRDIGEARVMLSNVGNTPLAGPPAGGRQRWAFATVGVCLLAIGVLGWGLWSGRTGTRPPETRFGIDPPPGAHFTEGGVGGGSALSPDGQTLAFIANTEKGEHLLFVRPMNSLEARPLPGTKGAGRPFWSPDSKSLAFTAQTKLKRMNLTGGEPVTLCDAGIYGRGGTWNEEGVILFANRSIGLQRIAATGGTPATVTHLNKEAGEAMHYFPQFLPGGKQFLYLTRNADTAKGNISVGHLDGRPAVSILQTQFAATYDRLTRLLFYMPRAGTVMAQRLELDPPRLEGDAMIVAEGVAASSDGYISFSVAKTGTLLYQSGTSRGLVRFQWRDRAGKLIPPVAAARDGSVDVALSPGGEKVALSTGAVGATDIWISDLAGKTPTRLTFSGGKSPRWSSDGRFLYFVSGPSIFRQPADGSGEAELVWKGNAIYTIDDVSHDGKYLIFGPDDLLVLPLTGDKKPWPYVQTPFNEGLATFSPDDRWVAYASTESGKSAVYVEGFPERRGRRQVSGESGIFPQWRADGKEIYWIGPNGALMASSVEASSGGLTFGPAQTLFNATTAYYLPFDGGRRFLMAEPATDLDRKEPMVVVQNWVAKGVR